MATTSPQDRAITILRIFLWLMPAAVIPFAYMLAVTFVDIWAIIFITTIATLAAIGYLDQRLWLHRNRIAPSIKHMETIHSTILFVLAQIFIGPLLFIISIIGFYRIPELFSY